jgi:hypothetical protein
LVTGLKTLISVYVIWEQDILEKKEMKRISVEKKGKFKKKKKT